MAPDSRLEDLKKMAYTNRAYDCSEITEDLQSIYGQGEVWILENIKGNPTRLKVMEYGVEMDYINHYVYSKDGMCLDIRYRDKWIPLDVYMDEIKKLNFKYGIVLKLRKEGE